MKWTFYAATLALAVGGIAAFWIQFSRNVQRNAIVTAITLFALGIIGLALSLAVSPFELAD
jgi:hypothetical protein